MIELLVLIAICGVIVWFVNTYIPMAPPFKMAINVIVAIALLLYVLNFFGFTDFGRFRHHR